MKNENDFNADLSKAFKRMSPELKSVKTSDRMSLGISDFMLYKNGKSAALEVKFVKELPAKDTSKILKHKFEGAQITYLEDIALTGNGAFGLVGILPERRMYLIDMKKMPKENRTEYYDFTLSELKKMAGVFHYEFSEVQDLIEDIF
jgi:penicillin-binding protein-related factor A (putative recombinase)